MADDVKTRIGFVSGGSSSMPHYNSFLPIVPKEVEIDFQGLNLYGKSLYEISDKKDVILSRVKGYIAERKWDGLILTAAPTEVLNPGLYDDLKAAVTIPFTTALNACVAALRVYSAPKVLLLTPFDTKLNDLIVAHLAKAGVTALSPNSFAELAVPKRMTPDEVFELTKTNLAAVGRVDAIYFQGAVLDPIKCLERIESELNVTVIASNPAMFWYVLSKLGKNYPMSGFGALTQRVASDDRMKFLFEVPGSWFRFRNSGCCALFYALFSDDQKPPLGFRPLYVGDDRGDSDIQRR